jgi:hypothetical protein
MTTMTSRIAQKLTHSFAPIENLMFLPPRPSAGSVMVLRLQ